MVNSHPDFLIISLLLINITWYYVSTINFFSRDKNVQKQPYLLYYWILTQQVWQSSFSKILFQFTHSYKLLSEHSTVTETSVNFYFNLRVAPKRLLINYAIPWTNRFNKTTTFPFTLNVSCQLYLTQSLCNTSKLSKSRKSAIPQSTQNNFDITKTSAC